MITPAFFSPTFHSETDTHRIHGTGIFTYTFTINITHSCTWTLLSGCQMDGTWGAILSNPLGFKHHPLRRVLDTVNTPFPPMNPSMGFFSRPSIGRMGGTEPAMTNPQVVPDNEETIFATMNLGTGKGCYTGPTLLVNVVWSRYAQRRIFVRLVKKMDVR